MLRIFNNDLTNKSDDSNEEKKRNILLFEWSVNIWSFIKIHHAEESVFER